MKNKIKKYSKTYITKIYSLHKKHTMKHHTEGSLNVTLSFKYTLIKSKYETFMHGKHLLYGAKNLPTSKRLISTE